MSPCKEINGVRPSPLKLNKESHHIQKSSSSSSSSNTSSKQTQQQRQPVIIYTYSPKIIHTKPRDFMALVQKLTGLSHSNDEIQREENGNDSYTTITGGGMQLDNRLNQYLSDVPYFTPNSSNDFCSSSTLYRYPDQMGGGLSHSMLEFLKGCPDYCN